MSGLLGALFTGVQGVGVQSTALGTIADNISNSQTVGYKRRIEQFETIRDPHTPPLQLPGSVKAYTKQTISQQGTLLSSAYTSNIGLQGRGFFAVATAVDSTTNTISSTGETAVTRKGDFSIDKNGNFVNASGYYLLGVAFPTTIPILTLVDVGLGGLGSTGTNTSVANTAATVATGTSTTQATLPTGATLSSLVPVKVRSDSAVAGVATTTIYDSVNLPAAASVGVGPTTTTAAAAAGSTTLTLASVTGLGVGTAVSGSGIASGTTITAIAGNTITLSNSITSAIASGQSVSFTSQPYTSAVPIYDTKGNLYQAAMEFTRTSASPNTWTATITSITAATSGAPTPVYTLPQTGTLSFDTAGKITSGTVTAAFTTTNGATSVAIDFTGKSATLGQVNPASTQLDDKFSQNSVKSDGLPIGTYTGYSISDTGVVSQNFSNGLTVKVYQIPVANYINPDGLEEIEGNAYLTSSTSGAAGLFLSKDTTVNTTTNPYDIINSTFQSSTTEQANVDLATEFTNMIVTQRDFSANSKVITTVDEMYKALPTLGR